MCNLYRDKLKSFSPTFLVLTMLCLGQACSIDGEDNSMKDSAYPKENLYLDSSEVPSNTNLAPIIRTTQYPTQQPFNLIIQNEQNHDNNQKSGCCCCESCKFKCCGCECGCCCCTFLVCSGCLGLGISIYAIGAYAFHAWPTFTALFHMG